MIYKKSPADRLKSYRQKRNPVKVKNNIEHKHNEPKSDLKVKSLEPTSNELNTNRKILADGLHKPNFPPKPPSIDVIENITRNYCKDLQPSHIQEAGCAVCGELQLIKDLTSLTDIDCDLSILCVEGVTRAERLVSDDPIISKPCPILDPACKHMCSKCLKDIKKNKIPLFSLAVISHTTNHMWLGEVPDVLKNLTYAKQMLICRVRHNRSIVRVGKGMHKMTANAIVFSHPTPI
ncbi:hypothetical protein BJ138DRAFT_1016019 [Hygrophoropsis aurantiaca]|uniref:Uncharacterized protein n=1 Tax=Hygrophoropsis aurantiaca TaxID=72124 RepID=A0ACB7ZZI7_9AGAM|nr:hypothetical protein BJ138DRAFT_1016019 [Hygrophoropsis aurantiaca]